MSSHLNERRLTCNRLFRHLILYSQKRFTGKLTVYSASGVVGCIYLAWGRLTWATGSPHPKRLWRRQFYLATGRRPDFKAIANTRTDCWDYQELNRLSQDQLVAEQVSTIIQGVVEEVLFDLVQTFESAIVRAGYNRSLSLLSLSALTGVGDGMSICAEEGVMPLATHRFPATWMPSVETMQQRIQFQWEQWVRLGRLSDSPNAAPTLIDSERLRCQTHSQVYLSLRKMLNGIRPLRDVALRLKRDRCWLSLARTLSPFIRQGIISLEPTGDLVDAGDALTQEARKIVLFIGIDGDRARRERLETLASALGYLFEGYSDPIAALDRLVSHTHLSAAAIWLSEDLPILSLGEFIGLLRRYRRLANTPAIAYGVNDRHRRRVQQAFASGVVECLTWEALENDWEVQEVFERYYAIATGEGTQTAAASSFEQTLDRGIDATLEEATLSFPIKYQ